MAERRARIRMEVSVNGVVRCVGGVGDFGVLNTIVTWVRRRPEMIHPTLRDIPEFNEADALKEELDVTLGGLDSTLDNQLDWLKESLKPGDVVTIRLLPEGDYDAPIE